ncbi:DUF3010 family protein [Psychrobium sp. 1_MG-2023]|uniref:DUF3010 family protein n=1 Tax=Psychrobium sp. 1_MG-2023 TaxID=3062624 RepID=UPI000C3218B1|nr:DUF3010 family protein [Psychrobium sp. 1_MG-2023]MDP2562407.1 DUF3010 family protein [Psychrobium sp. 1_MG-2023]PKF56136.1 DUF3010 domain-containing protein [Alteromonadales bacterium alter-6D02]
MRICAVDLKDNHANICIMQKDNDVFDIPDCRQQRLTAQKVNEVEDLLAFQFAFKKLMEDYQVDRVIIAERISNGKHAAKMSTFKLEAVLQVCAELTVELIPQTVEKQWLKRCAPPVEFKYTGLKPFQEKAFLTAYAYLSH